MKTKHIILVSFLIININFLVAQEWRSLKNYKKETGNSYLQEGNWLRKDRKKQTDVWQQANGYNLQSAEGYQKYESISQISAFYNWFDIERKKQGHEILWIGIASIATGQLSKIDCFFIRNFIVRNAEITQFANEGAEEVIKYSFPLLQKIYFSPEIIKGKAAEDWDIEFGKKEQCIILDSIYKKLSIQALRKLERMAKGKGIYSLAVPKKLKYDGDIENCTDRYEHGVKKLIPYYLSTQ